MRIAQAEVLVLIQSARMMNASRMQCWKVHRNMPRHAFNVAETFAIKGRGVVVVTDKTYEQLDQDVAVKIGDAVEFRNGDIVFRKSRVAGMEFSDPWSPRQLFAFLLPAEVNKNDIPVGAEIWLDESSFKRSPECS